MRTDLVMATGTRVSLRAAAAADEPFLRHLYADRRRPELAPAGWPEAAVTGFLDMQFRAQQQGYGSAFPEAENWIVAEESTPIGRILLDRGPLEHLVVDLVILSRCRGRGIGTAVMREVLADAADAGVPVRLTAATADPRLPDWYLRLGFHVVDQGAVDVRMVRGTA